MAIFYDYTGQELLMEETTDLVKKFEGKKIIILGDSVFDYEQPDGFNIGFYLNKDVKAEVHNWAQGGTCFAKGKAKNYDPYSFAGMIDALTTGTFTDQETYAKDRGFTDRVADMKAFDMSTADYCIIAYGTNDFWGFMLWKNDDDLFDVNTTYGAINYGLKTLMTKYPSLKILMVGMQNLGDLYNETTAWGQRTGGDHYNHSSYYDKWIKEISGSYAVPVLDIWNDSMINEFTKGTLANGQPHLNHEGKIRYAHLIENALNLYY